MYWYSMWDSSMMYSRFLIKDFFLKTFFFHFFSFFFSSGFFFYNKNYFKNIRSARRSAWEVYVRVDYDARLDMRDFYEKNQPEVYTGRVGIFFFKTWCITSVFIYNPELENQQFSENIILNLHPYVSNLLFVKHNRKFLQKIQKLKFDYF